MVHFLLCNTSMFRLRSRTFNIEIKIAASYVAVEYYNTYSVQYYNKNVTRRIGYTCLMKQLCSKSRINFELCTRVLRPLSRPHANFGLCTQHLDKQDKTFLYFG